MTRYVRLDINENNMVTKVHNIEEKLEKDPIILFTKWLVFMIENQTDLEKEYYQIGIPEWNKGYSKALQDCLEEINELIGS